MQRRGFGSAASGNARGKSARAGFIALLLFSLACCMATGAMAESPAPPNRPHGVAYFSITGHCLKDWRSSIAIFTRNGEKSVPGDRISVKGPPRGLLGAIQGYSTMGTQVFRFELSPGSYIVHHLLCFSGRTMSFLEARNKKTGEMGPNLGIAYFSIGAGEVISGGWLDAVGPPNALSLRVRPLNDMDMGYVRQTHPDEAARMKHRPVSPVRLFWPPAR